METFLSDGSPIGADQTQMFREAAEAAAVVRRQRLGNTALMSQAGRRLRALKPHTVVTCARGSSDHAATFAKYLIETRLGLPTASAAPSVSSVYAARPSFDGVLFLVLSQSGRSPDLVKAVETAKAGGAVILSLINAEGSPVEALADIHIPLRAGPETSVAATKSYVASLSALIHLVAAWTEDAALDGVLEQAPALLDRAFALDWSAAVKVLEPAQGLYVIGRGLGYGVAQEAALKLKETCGLHAEAFSAAEVRHGPMAIVGPGFPVLMMSQDDETRDSVAELAVEFAARDAQVMLAGAEAAGAVPLPAVSAHPVLQPMLLIQSFYRMAATLALARGRDPDRPPHLRKVTETL